jgi:hypothetical protein
VSLCLNLEALPGDRSVKNERAQLFSGGLWFPYTPTSTIHAHKEKSEKGGDALTFSHLPVNAVDNQKRSGKKLRINRSKIGDPIK